MESIFYITRIIGSGKRLISLSAIVFSGYILKSGSTGYTGNAFNLIQDILEIAQILGGAGLGKSFTIGAILNTLLAQYNHRTHICAPTGKAALVVTLAVSIKLLYIVPDILGR